MVQEPVKILVPIPSECLILLKFVSSLVSRSALSGQSTESSSSPTNRELVAAFSHAASFPGRFCTWWLSWMPVEFGKLLPCGLTVVSKGEMCVCFFQSVLYSWICNRSLENTNIFVCSEAHEICILAAVLSYLGKKQERKIPPAVLCTHSRKQQVVVCEPGQPPGLGPGRLQPAKRMFSQQEFNVFGVELRDRFCVALRDRFACESNLSELADTAVSYTWLWSAGAAVQGSALFSFPLQNSGLTVNNTCYSVSFETPHLFFRVGLGHLRSPSPSGMAVPLPSQTTRSTQHYQTVLKGACRDLWFPQLPSTSLRMALWEIYQTLQLWSHFGTIYSIFLRNRTDFLLGVLI